MRNLKIAMYNIALSWNTFSLAFTYSGASAAFDLRNNHFAHDETCKYNGKRVCSRCRRNELRKDRTRAKSVRRIERLEAIVEFNLRERLAQFPYENRARRTDPRGRREGGRTDHAENGDRDRDGAGDPAAGSNG